MARSAALRAARRRALHPLESAQELAIAMTHVPDLLRRRRLVDGHRHRLSISGINELLSAVSDRGSIPPTWIVGDVVPTVSDVAVVKVGDHERPFRAFLKIAQTESATRSLLAQAATLESLQASDGLGDWRRVLPRVLAHGEIDGRYFEIEEALSGAPISSLVGKRQWRPALLGAATDIQTFHRAFGSFVSIDQALLDEWIDEPLDIVRHLPMTYSRREQNAHLDRLRLRLERGLLGRTVLVTRVHGDFTPNNVLADTGSGRITGLLDWDQSAENRPAFIDIGQFALEAQRLATGEHLGTVVRSVCRDNVGFGDDEGIVSDFWKSQDGDRVEDSVVALLALLSHVKSNIEKAPRYASHRLWVFRTVEVVLGSLDD